MHVIRYKDSRGAIDPQRRLVKLADYNLWQPSSPEGVADWRPNHEIRSAVLGISLFTTGSTEKLHYHERTWETYQVLEGRLRIAVKPFRLAAWEAVTLAAFDMLILTPGTLHLVDNTCSHITQVIQTPPALSDRVIIVEQSESDAAKETLLALE